MRILINIICVLALSILLSGCAGSKPTSTTTPQGGKYSEDLSIWRPKVEEAHTATSTNDPDERKPTVYMEPNVAVNKQLDTVLDSIDRINLNRKFIDGFTIQVYSGKREEALNAKKTLTTSLPDLESEIQFTEPIFRVKVGKYYTRMDAQKDFVSIKKYFPAAIIIPEKITVN